MAAAPPRGGGGRVAERTTTDLASGVPPPRLTAPALVSAARSPATSTVLLGFSPVTLIAAGELPPRLRAPALHFGLHLRPSRPRPRLHGDCSDVPRPVVRQPPVGRLDCWAHSCVQPRVPEVDISHGLHVTAGGLHTPRGRRLTPCVELEAAYPGPVTHAASDGTSAPPRSSRRRTRRQRRRRCNRPRPGTKTRGHTPCGPGAPTTSRGTRALR